MVNFVNIIELIATFYRFVENNAFSVNVF